MNKKPNLNSLNKNTVNSDNFKSVEENKKNSGNAITMSKEKKSIEEPTKKELSGNKSKKENSNSKTVNAETVEKLISKEQERNDTLTDNKEKSISKSPYKINKPKSMQKEEIKGLDDHKEMIVSNKKSNKNISEKTFKRSQSKLNEQFDLNKAKEFCQDFEEYIEKSGLTIAFKIIFAEIINKHVHKDNLFQYTAMRLRQIGKELEDLKSSQP